MAKAKPEKNPRPTELAEKLDQTPTTTESARRFSPFLIGAIVSVLLCITIYWLRFNTVFGHPYVDDAYYVVLAKALATGNGYTLINTLSSGLQPMYPPGFAFILSLLWRIGPAFPQTIALLKVLQISSMLLAGILCFFYFKRYRQLPDWLALGIALVTVLSPSIVFFATSTLMSECVFFLLQMFTLVAIAECVRQAKANAERLAIIGAALAALFAAWGFLTRSIGVALIVAILLWLLKERLSKPLLLAGALIVVLVAPWQLYTRSHAPSEELKREQQGYITQNYLTQFWQRNAGEDDKNTVAISEIPDRVAKNVGNIIGQQIGLIFVSRLALIVGTVGFGVISILLSLLALLGLIDRARKDLTAVEIYVVLSLLFILLWPWEPMRFLLPLTPFLLFYVVQGGQSLYAWWQRDDAGNLPKPTWLIATAVVAVMFALNLVSNFEFIGNLDAQGRLSRGEMAEFTEIETMMNWVKDNVGENELCASLNPGLVYLYTNRKAVSAQDPIGNWEYWKKWGVRYLVLTKPYGVPERDTTGKPIRVAYQSKRAPMLRVIDLGTASERAPWPATMK